MALVLRKLTASDESAFFEGMKHWDQNDLSWYTFIWKPGMPYSTMMTILEKETKGIDIAPGRVPHSMLYGFLDGNIIGSFVENH